MDQTRNLVKQKLQCNKVDMDVYVHIYCSNGDGADILWTDFLSFVVLEKPRAEDNFEIICSRKHDFILFPRTVGMMYTICMSFNDNC